MNADDLECETCDAWVSFDRLEELGLEIHELPGCPGPREEKPASSAAARVELIHQLLDDRDPLTGEPREPIITMAAAQKLLDLAAADEGIRFPKGGVKPGAPVLDEATAFDDVIAAWKVPPSTLSLGPLEVRTSTVIPPGEFRLFPLEPKPFDDRIFAEAIESIRKDLCERQEKLRRVFFAGADFAKPEEEQPLIVTFPQMKQLDKLAASAGAAGQGPTQQCSHLPRDWDYARDYCRNCGMTRSMIRAASAATVAHPCWNCGYTLHPKSTDCPRCFSPVQRNAPPRLGLHPGPCCTNCSSGSCCYCSASMSPFPVPICPRPAPAGQQAALRGGLIPDAETPAPAPTEAPAPTKAPDADACICFMSRSRNCKATKHWGET
jgi:hypothetical protein